MAFSLHLTSEFLTNSNAEVKKNLKLFLDKTITPTKNGRQKNNDYTLFKPHRHLMQKAGISHFTKCSYSECGNNHLRKLLSILNMAIDFGRFPFPVLSYRNCQSHLKLFKRGFNKLDIPSTLVGIPARN